MTVYTSRYGFQWNYAAHDTGWGTGYNFAMRELAALLNCYLVSDSVTTPPGSPAENDAYFVPALATGAWSTQTGKIAAYQGGTWQYYTPAVGTRCYVASRSNFYWWNGSSLTAEATSGGTSGVLTVAGHSPDGFGNVSLVVADISGAAPLSSPALSGVPTAPTASPLTRNTQLATTAYADNAVTVAVIGSGSVTAVSNGTGITHTLVSGTLTITVDTTVIATQSYVSTALAGYLPLAGGTLTGALHLSAPGGTDNTDKAVSSAWVRTYVTGLGFGTGSGTVTSVALTLPADLSVSGSPITTSGTFAITRANQNANIVLAGPSSGSPATPGYRALVAADLPGTVALTTGFTMSSDLHLSAPAGSDNTDKAVSSAWVRTYVTGLGFGTGSGTVTSVSITLPADLSVSGSPVTTSGTFAITRANQNANLFLAGPSSGGAATPAYRAIADADLPLRPYIVSAFYPGVPTNSQLLLVHKCGKAITFASNFGTTTSGAATGAGCTVNATGSTAITIDKCVAANDPTVGGNWTNIGTLTIGAGGHAATLATAGGSAQTAASGDFLRAVGPATADATAANIFITLAADR